MYQLSRRTDVFITRCNYKVLPPFPYPYPLSHLLLMSVTPCGMEYNLYHFDQFGSVALVMSPTHLLPTPRLLAQGRVGVEGRLEGVYKYRVWHCMGCCGKY